MSNFTEVGASAPVARALERRGITEPFEIQNLVLRDAISGRDVLAKSRTGSGKTLAFAVPIVERIESSMRRPGALVLVPTRELATQVVEEMSDIAAARNLRVAAVYGGVGLEKQAQRAAKAHVVVATPGRLQDLLDRRMLSLDHVSILVLDEADRMLDMGFQPQVDRIVKHVPGQRQTMFFSATLDGRVGNLAGAYTKDPARHEVRDRRPTISAATHRFVPVAEDRKIETLLDVLAERRGLALVFVRTKHGADKLKKKLGQRGVEALALHGNKTQAQRQSALSRFATGRVDVLIATDVAARGLDLDDITHVVNFDPPHDHTDYVHRVGRTARAGRSGAGVTFVVPDKRHDVSLIARKLKLGTEFEADGLLMTAPPPAAPTRRRDGRPQPRRRSRGRSGRR